MVSESLVGPVKILSPQLSRQRDRDERQRAQEISELRETSSPARTSSSGGCEQWLVVEHEARTSKDAGTLCPVMVGRGGELAQLQRAWQAGGQMLVVPAKPGSARAA